MSRASRSAKWLAYLYVMGTFVTQSSAADFWVTGYYPGWQQSSMDVGQIDFSTVTHVIHFALTVQPDASLDETRLSLSPSRSAAVISRAHATQRKALICVGGAGSQTGFQAATAVSKLPTLIRNLTNIVATRGYDGVDIDWEPVSPSDSESFTRLVRGLRSALDQLPAPRRLLTAAVPPYPDYGVAPSSYYPIFSAVQDSFDQINMMGYDLSGPYEGWVTWHNAPLFNGGNVFPSTGGPLPSVDAALSQFLSSGVASGKLGLGMPFYGAQWKGPGLSKPRQGWSDNSVPTVTAESYQTFTSRNYPTNLYHWDSSAQAAWIGITNVPAAQQSFISFDDGRAVQTKVSHAINRKLGGVMIWELSQDYFPSKPSGQRNPLISALHQAVQPIALTATRKTGNRVEFQFTAMPLGSYRVQWTDDLGAGKWNSLLVTNYSGPAGTVTIGVPFSAGDQGKFYRVISPQ